jgi:hypothetical protein
MSKVPAGHYECRTPVSSRRLCYDVPLYYHEAQRRGLALHLPHHPLPVGHLIGRAPLRYIGHPVFQHRRDDARQLIRGGRDGLREPSTRRNPPEERPQGTLRALQILRRQPQRLRCTVYPPVASRSTSPGPLTFSGWAPGRANCQSASHSATGSCRCRSHATRRVRCPLRSPR